jgi:cytochrome c oxidase subunit 3
MTHAPAEQFDDLEQQHQAAELGMWTFLTTEVLFFGGLFTAYALYRWNYPQAFLQASHQLYLSIGVANTAILLISSLTMALAVRATATGPRRHVVLYLLATLGLGLLFLLLKAVEYRLDYVEHLVPGASFHYEGPADSAHVELFMVLYFIMTGLHAAHMVAGVGCVGVLALRAARACRPDEYATFIEMTGLYWHFVDIVWLFLLSLLYLL